MHKLLNHQKHSTLVHVIIDWYQMLAGLSQPLLAYPTQNSNYVSNVWFQDLLNFMRDNNIRIIVGKTLIFTIQRRSGKCVMNEFTREKFTKIKFIQLNTCRLYLNLIYVSDIVNSDGKTITIML